MTALAEETVLVTGASGGIGRELVRAFAAAGAKVIAVGRVRDERLEAVEAELQAAATPGLAFATDLRYAENVGQLRRDIEAVGAAVTVAVNNAAAFAFGPVVELEPEDWERVLRTNLTAPFLVCRAFVPAMIERERGTVVMIGSTAGLRGDAGASAYCASKFGLRGLAECLFREGRRHNIRVLTVHPSSVRTDGAEQPAEGKGSRLSASDVAQTVVEAVALPGRAMIRELELWCTNP